MIEQSILSYLMNNAPNKFYSYEIEASFGVNGATVRDAVNTLRRQGHPICSSHQGYWYSSDPNEIQQTIDNLENRAKGINQAVTGLTQAKTVATSTPVQVIKINPIKSGRNTI